MSDHYCLQLVAPQGSDNYYALRFTQPLLRQRLVIVMALHEALTASLIDSLDPIVKYKKFAWWRNQITGLANRSATHPICTAWLDYQLSDRIDAAKLEALCETLWSANPVAHNPQQNTNYHQAITGSLYAILAEACGVPAEHITGVTQLGTAVGMVNSLHMLASGKASRQLIFSAIASTAHHADVVTEFPAEAPEVITKKLQTYCQHTSALLQERALHCFASAELLPLFILAQLKHRLLSELEHSGLKILHEEIHLTPLNKLWIAWRARRHHNRHTRSSEARL